MKFEILWGTALLLNTAHVAAFALLNSVTHSRSQTAENSHSPTEMRMGLKTEVIKSVSKIGAPTTAAIAGAAVLGTVGVKYVLDRPSRKYEDGSVAREYDAWTQDGILEYYWGEHIHLGYYNDEE